jgi:outer membrane protein assembly factor BamE
MIGPNIKRVIRIDPSTQTARIMSQKQLARLTLLTALFLGISACGSVTSLDFPGVYKIGIPQGNIITQEMVDQLRPGMTKRQVIFVMGTPLVRDPFHQDRWDYIYSFQPGGGERGQERLTVFFENELLVRFTGDFVPTEAASN